MALLDRIDLDELAMLLQFPPSPSELELRKAVEIYRRAMKRLGHERALIFAGGYLLANMAEEWEDLVPDLKARCLAVYRDREEE